MTHVVTEACIRCRYTDCVSVCPVDCFHAGPDFLVIDPDACIDCAVCIPECPVEAIKADRDLTPDQQDWLQINANLAAAWPVITEKTHPYPEADSWAKIPSKKHLLGGG